MGDLAKLKDHVDHQLDVRAPFAFLFNQVTQVPPDNSFIAGQDRRPEEWELGSGDEEQTPYADPNYPVQVDPGRDGRVGEGGAQGSLYQITQDFLGARDGRTNRTEGGRRDHVNPNPFQDKEGAGTPRDHPVHPGAEGEGPRLRSQRSIIIGICCRGRR